MFRKGRLSSTEIVTVQPPGPTGGVQVQWGGQSMSKNEDVIKESMDGSKK